MKVKKCLFFIYLIIFGFSNIFSELMFTNENNYKVKVPSSLIFFNNQESLQDINVSGIDLLLKYQEEFNYAESAINCFKIIEHLSELKLATYPEEFWPLFEASCCFENNIIPHALAREYIKKIQDPRQDYFFISPNKISEHVKDFIRKQYFLMTNDHDILQKENETLTLNIEEIAYSRMLEILNCKLDLSNMHLSSIDGIYYVFEVIPLDQIHQIQQINLSNNCLTSIPEELCKASQIQILNISNNKIKSLPINIWNMKSLLRLDAKNNKLKSLPETICYLEKLWRLDLSDNKLQNLPEQFSELKTLKWLTLDNNQINFLPKNFESLELQKSSFKNNPISDDYRKNTKTFHNQNKKNIPALSDKLYFCTASDEGFFSCLMQLIGSIHKTNYDKTEEIAVFDLGITNQQRNFLNTIEKVKVYDIEITNPDLLTKFKTNSFGKTSRGFYAWKPVILKQMSEKFDYFLYLDAGTTILKPLDDLFKHIQIKGHFFIEDQVWDIKIMDKDKNFTRRENVTFKIRDISTQHVINKFELNKKQNLWIAESVGLLSGVQGITKALYKDYLLPTYELSKDLKNFADDGSAPRGFGWARHDQTISGIFAKKLKLDFTPTKRDVYLDCGDKIEKFYFADENGEDKTHIFYACKGVLKFQDFIKYKK